MNIIKQNQFKLKHLAFIGAALFTLTHCAPKSLEQGSMESALENSQVGDITTRAVGSHIKYFGYYASAASWVGAGNYINAISNHANLAWIADCGNEVAKLQQLKAARMYAMIDVGCYFFKNFNLIPKAQYEQNWNDFVKRVAPYRSYIAAFYPMDEPYLNASRNGVAMGTMINSLNTVNAVIKASYPSKARAVIFSASEMYYGGFQIPSSFDWAGFDCYGKWEKCYDNKSIPELLAKLHSMLASHQRSFLVPDANFNGYPDYGQQGAIGTRAYQYFELAKANGRVIGLMPFIYQSFADSSGHYTGVMDMPGALPSYRAIGREIASANPSCFPLTFVGGSLPVKKVAPGSKFIVNCDYGKIVDSIFPDVGKNPCVGIAFNGTAAQFSCTAPATPGTLAVNCKLGEGTSSKTCGQTNFIGTLTIAAP